MSDLTPVLSPQGEALKNLLDGIHAGRFIVLNAASEGYCKSLVDAGEAALRDDPQFVDAASICDAEAARWRKEADRHLPHYNSDCAKRDLARAKICEDLARKIRAAPPAAEGYRLNANKSVAVSNVTFWNEGMEDCPRGCKVQLLGRGGVAVYSNYDGDSFWKKWAPLPRNRS